MMRRAFDQDYRRYEWKCDDLNAPSRLAAKRLGFTYEGTFRQATHYKGRNRGYCLVRCSRRRVARSGRRVRTLALARQLPDDGMQQSRLDHWS